MQVDDDDLERCPHRRDFSPDPSRVEDLVNDSGEYPVTLGDHTVVEHLNMPDHQAEDDLSGETQADLKRSAWPTCKIAALWFAAAIIRSASASVGAMGFSTST